MCNIYFLNRKIFGEYTQTMACTLLTCKRFADDTDKRL